MPSTLNIRQYKRSLITRKLHRFTINALAEAPFHFRNLAGGIAFAGSASVGFIIAGLFQ